MRNACLLLLLSFSAFLHAADDAEPTFNRFEGLSGDEWVNANSNEAQRHFELWKQAAGAERAKEAEAVKFYAWRSDHSEMLDAVIADGKLAETEVKAPGAVTSVTVKPLLEVDKGPHPYGTGAIVWRRITPSAFEIWNSAQGWLFDAKGHVLHTAKVPRKDGFGRQWLGAFLPDGHWITTELLENDGRVYIFDAKGRCRHEIKAGNLLNDPPWRDKTLIIPWARSTKGGNTWLVWIGSEGGKGGALLSPDGTWTVANEKPSAWQRCMARQLGIRLAFGICFFETESDDGLLQMTSEQPAHGSGVGNPDYEMVSAKDRVALGNIPGDGRGFGFWPRSHAAYIFNDRFTWFFDADGKYVGWADGERVGDAVDRKSMIFRRKDGVCVTASPELRATKAQKFTLPDGITLYPLDLQTDIGLGVFVSKPMEEGQATTSDFLLDTNPKVIVARWKTSE